MLEFGETLGKHILNNSSVAHIKDIHYNISMTAQSNNKSAYVKGQHANLNTFSQVFLYNLTDFFRWWYMQMPILYIKSLARVLLLIDDNFSITLLVETFFVPWKRDNNIIGHFMGIAVRLVYLPIAILIYIIALLIYVILILFWILIPVMSVLFIFISLII